MPNTHKHLCMKRVDADEFFEFLASYATIASEPDPLTLKFTGKNSGDCVGRVVYGDAHKRYYINLEHTEPEVTVAITPEGTVQYGYLSF